MARARNRDQVIKTLRVKHANDLSMGMLLITLGSGVLYEIYAWRLELWPVIIMNGLAVCLVTTEVLLKIRYDHWPVHAHVDSLSPEGEGEEDVPASNSRAYGSY